MNKRQRKKAMKKIRDGIVANFMDLGCGSIGPYEWWVQRSEILWKELEQHAGEIGERLTKEMDLPEGVRVEVTR